MMLIERQVTSLALSQRLAKLGVKQEASFWWREVGEKYAATLREFPFSGALMGDGSPILQFGEEDRPVQYEHRYAAFTVAELGEMLGQKPLPYRINIGWEWYVRDHVSKADTEAEARGFMLEYLITNGLLKI